MALADPEVLPEPDACEECDVCCTDVEDAPGEKILRCSVCKDRFYCSPRCQKADWKLHKYTCSPLNGPLEAPAYTPEQLDKEVERASKVLEEWMAQAEHYEDFEDSRGAEPIRDFVLPPELALTRPCHEGTTHPYRHPLMSITRLYLLHLVAHASAAERADLALQLLRMSPLHPHPRPPYGPKYAARAGALAPGEYEQLMQSMAIVSANMRLPENARGRWWTLGETGVRLWRVGVPS